MITRLTPHPYFTQAWSYVVVEDVLGPQVKDNHGKLRYVLPDTSNWGPIEKKLQASALPNGLTVGSTLRLVAEPTESLKRKGVRTGDEFLVRETQGNIARLNIRGHRHSLHFANKYTRQAWVVCDSPGLPADPLVPLGSPEPCVLSHTVTDTTNVTNETKQNEQKETTMTLKIENVTLVNGNRSQSLSTDQLLRWVELEQESLKRLEDLKLKDSAAIKSLISKHKGNIESLVKIMEENA